MNELAPQVIDTYLEFMSAMAVMPAQIQTKEIVLKIMNSLLNRYRASDLPAVVF